MQNSRVAVGFVQSLELKGEIDEAAWNRECMKSTRASHFTFHASRFKTSIYIENSRVVSIILVLVALHKLFTSPVLVNYVIVPLGK